MAKTKDQLRTENNANFPNNNSQFITPEKLRGFNTDIIDSVALEVNPQLSGEGTFGSLSGSGAVSASTYYGDGSNLTGVIAVTDSGSLLITASFNNLDRNLTFTKGDLSTFDVSIPGQSGSVDYDDVTNKPTLVSGSSQIILQETTGDLSGSRIDGQVSSALSSSYAVSSSQAENSNTSISSSFATTASFALNAETVDTGSLLTTASVNLNTITFTKGDASTFDITVDTGSAGDVTDITALNDFTASQETKNTTLETVTSSIDNRLNNIEGETGSYAKTDEVNEFTGSQLFQLPVNLKPTNNPASSDSRFKFDSYANYSQFSLVTPTGATDREIRFYPSASYAFGFPQNSEMVFNITENGVFGYRDKLGITNLTGDNRATFEISGSTDGDSSVIYLNSVKVMEYNWDADFIVHNNINARGGIDAQGRSTFFNGIEVQNGFTASLSSGNFFVGNGSNITQEISTSSLSVSSSLDAQDLIIGVKNTSAVTLPKGTPVYATGVTGENINIESASNASSATMPAIGILNEELTPNAAGFAVLSGRIIGVDTNGFTAGNNIYVNTDGTFTETKPTGSALIQNIGVVGKVDASDGEIVVIGSGRTNDVPNITEGYAWVGNGDGVATATSTASWDAQADLTSLNAFTASQESKNTTLETVTSSFDSRLDNIELATGSYATTGSNTFIGNQIISGSSATDPQFEVWADTTPMLNVGIGGSVDKYVELRRSLYVYNDTSSPKITLDYLNTSSSLEITTDGFTLTSSSVLNNLITFDQFGGNKQLFIGSGDRANTNGLTDVQNDALGLFYGEPFVSTDRQFYLDTTTEEFIFSGSVDFNDNVTISGSSAYEVISPSIASLTASIDFGQSAMQVVTLVSGSDTHIAATNVDKGQTINLLVKQPAVGTGSLSFSYDFLQATGSEYTPTPSSNAKDILTFITFDSTTEIYVSNITEFV